MSNRAAKLAKQQKLEQMARKTRIQKLPLAIVLGLATLLGGVAAAVTLLPRLTIDVSDPVNPDDPSSSSITITNTGYIPLDSVTPGFGIGKVVYGKAPFDTPAPSDNEKYGYSGPFHVPEWGPHDMKLDDKITIAMNQIVRPTDNQIQVVFADVEVMVDYEIPVIHLRRQRIFRLATKRQTNGHLYWYSRPADSI